MLRVSSISEAFYHVANDLTKRLLIGPITVRNLTQMLPYPDPMVVLEMDGEALWIAMETGLGMYPTQAG